MRELAKVYAGTLIDVARALHAAQDTITTPSELALPALCVAVYLPCVSLRLIDKA